MLESFFYSQNGSFNKEIIDLNYIFFIECIVWIIIYNLFFPYSISMRFEKYFSRPLLVIIGYLISLIVTMHLNYLGSEPPTFRLNTELISMICIFILMQTGYMESEKTLFKKRIIKKHISWFDKKV